MGSIATTEVVDLLILVDATASMTSYLASLKQSLPQIISIASLTNCFRRIALLAYRDYCDRDLLEWSGWMTVDEAAAEGGNPDLVGIASRLVATGGGDYPEATKTGLAKAYEVMSQDAKTLILLYTDAPPHRKDGEDTGMSNARAWPRRATVPAKWKFEHALSAWSYNIEDTALTSRGLGYDHAAREQKALLQPESYGGYGHLFADWVSAAHTLRGGPKKAQVLCVLDQNWTVANCNYMFLSHLTGGACMMLTNGRSKPREISEVTVQMLLAWMGVKKEGTEVTDLPIVLWSYTDPCGILEHRSENDRKVGRHLPSGNSKNTGVIKCATLTTATIEFLLPKKQSPIQNFSKTYRESANYRSLVTTQLRRIVEQDVTSISLNPVFGSLWRTFCNDRENESRQELLDLFGRKVDDIRDATQKAKMKAWLEESYNYAAEVQETVERVPAALRFPCVCLDPTLVFETAKDGQNDDEDANKPITAFRRDELLEIGRSCDWRILRRLGKILTRLTFIESAEAMPAHISGSEVTMIPLALASPEYGRRFWKMLLHIVVSGTMLGGRAAALLAALTIQLGVQPLMQAAEMEMLLWKEKWNDIEIPETWNTSCLSLLLDADEAYRARHENGLLLNKDRDLFKRLVEYKLLELNLNTTLDAKISWTPHKTAIKGGGKFIVCRSCEYLRSVSVMGADGICGPCWCNIDRDPEAKPYSVHTGMEKTQDEIPLAYWYECSMRKCRGQYVVYDIEALNVRPKCHYCRINQPAPMVECVKCLSRVIWPEEYRDGEDMTDFQCAGCQTSRETIIQCPLTANALREENGIEWLLHNKDQMIKQPFNNRSLYHTASTSQPLYDFCEKVSILPTRNSDAVQLRYHGKPLHNTPQLISQLYTWIFSRRTESGTCSLCFCTARKETLLPACGRSGCQQKVCKDCLQGWYGLNMPGHIINTAALHCPFCRRVPTSKTLLRSGQGVHAVGGLADAVARSGEFIFAWCAECGFAREYMERVCAVGAPEGVQRFICEECHAKKGGEVERKACLGCGILTEKISGCDHVQCTVCGVHWCFFCGEKQEEDEIYAHMSERHGGYYGGAEEEEAYNYRMLEEEEGDFVYRF